MHHEDALRPRAVLTLAALLTIAFAARVGARFTFGQNDFWINGYTSFYETARQIAAGGGYCAGTACVRPPLYPALLALTVRETPDYWLVVIPQACLGAGTALLAFLIARLLFGLTAGLIAAAITALYPYYVAHDTALQDTGPATFLLALAVWLTLRARRHDRGIDWLLCGAALGAAVLMRAALAPLVAMVPLWLLCAAGPARRRLRRSGLVVLTAFVVVAPWLAYTWRATGAPVLTTHTGYELWVGHNALTFSRYPAESIDRSTAQAAAALSADERAALRAHRGDALAQSRVLSDLALAYIRDHPLETLEGAGRKLVAAFSWRLNPHRETLAQAAYAAGYAPVSVLGIAGMVMAWRRPGTRLIALLFIAFAGVAVVFSAQSSHRSVLDVYWIVYAAFALLTLMRALKRRWRTQPAPA